MHDRSGVARLITGSVQTSFAPAKVFKGLVKQPRRDPRSAEEPPRNEITSICFSDSGDLCTVAGQDDYFTTYDVKTGK